MEVEEEAEGVWQVAGRLSSRAQALLKHPLLLLGGIKSHSRNMKIIVGVSTGAALSGVGSSPKNVDETRTRE